MWKTWVAWIGSAGLASFLNMTVLSLVFYAPSPIYPEYDALLVYQTGSALAQCALLALLCPRTLFVDDYFAIAIDGPAQDFTHTLQVVCLACLVGLSTNNALSTAISFGHRLWVILGKRATLSQMLILLPTCALPYFVTTIMLMFTEDYSTSLSEATKAIGYNITTYKGIYTKGVAVCTPIIVLLFAICKVHHLLHRLTGTTFRTVRREHCRLLQIVLYETFIPVITAVGVLVWFGGHKKIFEPPQFLEYILFGVGPPILSIQALIPLLTTDRYRRAFNPDFWTYVCIYETVYGVCVFIFFYKSRYQDETTVGF